MSSRSISDTRSSSACSLPTDLLGGARRCNNSDESPPSTTLGTEPATKKSPTADDTLWRSTEQTEASPSKRNLCSDLMNVE